MCQKNASHHSPTTPGYAGQTLNVGPENVLIATPVEGIMLAMQCLLSRGAIASVYAARMTTEKDVFVLQFVDI